MAMQLIGELEAATKILLAPPNLITHEQRQSAEAIFLNFRNLNSPYQLCKQIFETSSIDYILFETAGLLKIALVQEWILLAKEDIASLREYLLHYVKSKPRLAEYVKSRIILVIVVIVKKESVDDNAASRHALLKEAESLISSGNLPMQILGCNILSALLQEYALDAKSSAVGLTLETHLEERKKFEVPDAQNIFQLVNRALSQLIEKDTDEAVSSLMKHLLAILESILACDFDLSLECYERRLADDDSGDTPMLMLSEKWRHVMLDPRMLDFFFRLYWKVQRNPQLAHHARTCLIQLANLSGHIFEVEDEDENENVDEAQLMNMSIYKHPRYLLEYWSRFSKLISNAEISDQEAAGFAEIMKKLMLQFGRFKMPRSVTQSFLKETIRLTCFFIEKAAQEESMCVDECLYTEALRPMLEVGIDLLVIHIDKSRNDAELHKEGCMQIFNAYLRHHLFPPDGVRTTAEKELNEEDIDIEEDDKIRFKEQLQLIGHFARKILDYTLPLLARLIEDRTAKLSERLNVLVSQNKGMNKLDNSCMSALYEDIHWLILVGGHVLCMESQGEVALLPREIACYSIEQRERGKVDINATSQYLASAENLQMDLNNISVAVEPVTRIIADVFRLCAIEKTAISVNLSEILSPVLTCTNMWFLQRCCFNFFEINESYYAEINPTFLELFGVDTPGAKRIMNFLLERVEDNITAFRSEPTVVKATVDLLMALTYTEGRKFSYKQAKSLLIAKSESFGLIVELATKGRCDFAPEIKRDLMEAIVKVGSDILKSAGQDEFWSQTLGVLEMRFKGIVSKENFLRSYDREEIKTALIDILHSLIGAMKPVQFVEFQPIFQRISPIIVELSNLLSLYHNYPQIVQLILEFLCGCTQWSLRELPTASRSQIYQVCYNIMQSYSRFNINRLTIETTAEEDAFRDIFLLLKLVGNVVGSDYATNDEHIPGYATSTDVFGCGLNTVMSIVTMDLLKFPTLCEQYFQTLLRVVNLKPGKVCDLSPGLLQQVLNVIELGLTAFGYKAAGLSYQIIATIANHIRQEPRKEKRSQVMAPCMNVLISSISTHQFRSDLIPDAGRCLYSLIHCYPDQYQQLVQNVLSSQSNQKVQQRLAEEFTKLIPTTRPEDDHYGQIERHFVTKFENFVTNVQGFLIVK